MTTIRARERGRSMTVEVVRVATGAPPASTFALPADDTKPTCRR